MKLLKFYADWCSPCKEMTKRLERANIEVTPINVDTEEAEHLTEKFDIRNLPTIISVDDGNNELKRFVGLVPIKDIIDYINEEPDNYLNN